MSDLRFSWSRAKAASNLRKHGVDMSEARSIFDDPLARTLPDPDHSLDEWRYITVGRSRHGRLLLVAHAEDNETIRVISARPATSAEKRRYEES